jgi:hypothetical protein
MQLYRDAQCEEVKYTGIENPSVGLRTFSQNSDILLCTLTKIFYTENPFENCVIHMSLLLFLPISYLKRLLPAAKAGSSFFAAFFSTVAQCECNILNGCPEF